MKTPSQSLINHLANLTGMPRVLFALAVGLFLVSLLLGAAHADGDLTPGGPFRLWKMGLEPAVVVYILCTSPLLQKRWSMAIETLRPLADRPEFVERAHVVDMLISTKN